jgi:hypothetical protein
VDDTATGAHPLQVARPDHATIAEAVLMLDLPTQHVRDGLHAAMRVPGKPGLVLSPIVGPEIVEEEKGIILFRRTEADGAVKVHPGAFHCGMTLYQLADASVVHRILSRFGNATTFSQVMLTSAGLGSTCAPAASRR